MSPTKPRLRRPSMAQLPNTGGSIWHSTTLASEQDCADPPRIRKASAAVPGCRVDDLRHHLPARAQAQVPPSDAADDPIEQFDRVVAVNQRGVWSCMKHELRIMRRQGSGAIVNCSSLGGLVGLPQRAAYHGTKHAVLGMTKSAGVEYAPRGIRINAVCPGTIDTPMVADMLQGQSEAMAEIMKQQSIGRLGRPEEVAAAVLWLCSPAASFVIGIGLPVDGGFTAH